MSLRPCVSLLVSACESLGLEAELLVESSLVPLVDDGRVQQGVELAAALAVDVLSPRLLLLEKSVHSELIAVSCLLIPAQFFGRHIVFVGWQQGRAVRFDPEDEHFASFRWLACLWLGFNPMLILQNSESPTDTEGTWKWHQAFDSGNSLELLCWFGESFEVQFRLGRCLQHGLLSDFREKRLQSAARQGSGFGGNRGVSMFCNCGKIVNEAFPGVMALEIEQPSRTELGFNLISREWSFGLEELVDDVVGESFFGWGKWPLCSRSLGRTQTNT